MTPSKASQLLKTWFKARPLVLATMHRKEEAIAPIVEAALGVQVVLPEGFDSDRFGTFAGNWPRPADQRTTALIKARAGLELVGGDLAIASEGSFGPHPVMPYLPCDREMVVLLDRRDGQEFIVVGEDLTVETNFRRETIRSPDEVEAFLQQVGYPSHAVIVKTPGGEVFKGITRCRDLRAAVDRCLQQDGIVMLETDMRALYNPTRMLAIARATQDLVSKLQQICPKCSAPGFAAIDRLPGLPCGWCGQPTSLTRSIRARCQRCEFSQETLFPDGVQTADPMHCAFCNP
ncbi:hypothetical protein H6F67_05850 [Microcoleus sp. FACHB-1515]|nr:hypothetical protein [Microcoleus sp. FACHB-1515]